MTQFGFNFYYYYWLTSDRTFKLTTPEIFFDKAKKFEDTSSLHFLRLFFIEQSAMTFNHLKGLYLKGDFKNVAMMMGSTIKIEVKDSLRKKFTNLRIAESYDVMSMDENYYHVRGDDFRMHKYSKNNFNIIKVAV